MLAFTGAPAAAGTAGPGSSVEDLLNQFVAGLSDLRAGNDDAASALEGVAAELCERHDRCDAVNIASFYASLPAAARREGLEAEARFGDLHGRVYAAEGLDHAAWAEESESIRADLDRLIADCRDAADPVPAGRALCLSAQLLGSRVSGGRLDRATRREVAERAEAEAREAIELLQRAGMVKVALKPRHTLALLLSDMGRGSAARTEFETLKAESERIDYAPYREHAVVGLIDLARSNGDVREEERHIETLATFRQPDECWALTHRHGWRLLMTDNALGAMEFLERNRPRGGDEQELVEWNFLMSMAATWLGDPELAQTYLDEAYFDVPGHEPYVLAQARIDLARGDYHSVLGLLTDSYVLDGLAELERVVAQTILGEALLRTGMVEAATEELEYALELCERFSDAVEDERELAGGPLGVIGEWMGLHTIALLAEAYAERGRDLEAARLIEDCQSRSLRTDLDMAELRVRAGKPAGGPRLSREDLLAWARASDLGLVTWVVGAEHSVVVHVDPQGRASARVTRLGRSQVQEGARRLRERARSAQLDALRERVADTGAELARSLLPDSLLAALAAGGLNASERTLLALVHGPVESLPLSLLDVDGRSLDELCTLRVLPGVPTDRPGEAPVLDLRDWSLLGAPAVSAGAADLPAARAELRALALRYGDANSATGEAFTAETTARLFGGDRPLHISTHVVSSEACASDRYADVGLLLSHGEVLCIEELAQIRPRLPLAVLSACGSGRGESFDAEGQQSLARVLLESGTRNVLVTLWPVGDEAARTFARHFHDALQAGESPSSATRAARSAMRAGGAPPDDWAVFRLVGRD